MPKHYALPMLLCGGASMLLTVAPCTTQARQAQPTEKKTIIVRPARGRAVATVNATQNPADAEKQEIRIERQTVDGQEKIRLWIDGKEIKVEDMEDVEEAIETHDGNLTFNLVDADDAIHRGVIVQVPGHGESAEETFRTLRLARPDGLAQPEIESGSRFIVSQPKAMLGVALAPLSEDLSAYLGLDENVGSRITSVVDDSPAAKAGLKENDIIIAATIGSEEHNPISTSDLRQAISQAEPETAVTLTVLRKGDKKKIKAKLTAWDANAMGITGERSEAFELTLPEMFNGREIQLETLPMVRERLLEIQPRLREMQIDTGELLKDRPDREQMLKSMEQQMQQIQQMLDQLREQQNQLREQLKKSDAPEA